mmetsp:Transcript_23062/g.71866  ORF Transcript_23062/g.71866 Transcript_23062/m.71866 type:complete len:215 (-) Transcript_23062:41-685(-)
MGGLRHGRSPAKQLANPARATAGGAAGGAGSPSPAHSAWSCRALSHRSCRVTSPPAQGLRREPLSGNCKVTGSLPLNLSDNLTGAVEARHLPKSFSPRTELFSTRQHKRLQRTARRTAKQQARSRPQGAQSKQQGPAPHSQSALPSSRPFSVRETVMVASCGSSGGPPKRMRLLSSSKAATSPSKSRELRLARSARLGPGPRRPPRGASRGSPR